MTRDSGIDARRGETPQSGSTRSAKAPVREAQSPNLDSTTPTTGEDDVERLRELLARATPGPWRRGADLIRVHPDWRDEHGNASPDGFHRNGFAKTIATVGKEDGDWRDIEQQVADATLIVEAVNALPTLLTALAAISPTTEDAEKRALVEALRTIVAGDFNCSPHPHQRLMAAQGVAERALASIGERS